MLEVEAVVATEEEAWNSPLFAIHTDQDLRMMKDKAEGESLMLFFALSLLVALPCLEIP